MPIDPNIALAVRVAPFDVRIPTPIDRYARMLSLRNLMSESQTQQLKQQQLEQAAADDAALRALYAQNTEPSAAQLYTAAPRQAPDILKGRAQLKSADLEGKIKETTLNRDRATALGQLVQGVTDDASLARSVNEAVKNFGFDQAQGQLLVTQGYAHPDTQAFLKSAQTRALTASQFYEKERADAEEVRKQQLFPEQLAQAQTASLAGQLKTAAQTVPDNQSDWDRWREKLSPELQSRIPAMYSPTARELVERLGLTSAERATVAHQKVMEKQGEGRLDIAQQGLALREQGLNLREQALGQREQTTRDSDEALVQTVIENPAAFNRLTPSAQTRIMPLLREKGFTQFGKPLTESAMGKMAESRSAIESLRDLRQTLKDNEQYIGPISGFQALNPYSEARQAQAKIDLVKQRVGKALEGGVLRKEDEEKYKRILATLRDTPETAISKVDNLITTLERDMQLFENEQRRGGRNVPPRETEKEPEKKAATGGGQGPITVKAGGKTYTFSSPEAAEAFKRDVGIQ